MLVQIEEYWRESPATYTSCWEIQERLLKSGVCDRFNVPSISAISRLQQRHAASFSLPTSVCRRTSNNDKHLLNGQCPLIVPRLGSTSGGNFTVSK